MDRPLFSVLMPAYNCEFTLLAAVDSVFRGHDVPIEAIIVDDASTDSTPHLADELARRDSRIKVIHRVENGGDGPTRNTGLASVAGEWLILLDSDDMLVEGSVKALADHIGRGQGAPDVLITRYRERDTVSNAFWSMDECFLPEMAERGPFDPAELSHSLLSTVRSVIANKVCRVDYLREYGLSFQSVPRVGDVLFTIGTLAQARTIEFVDVELYEYRKNHGVSLTSTGDSYPLSFAEACEALYAFLADRDLLDTWYVGFMNWFIENTFYNLTTMRSLEGFAALFDRLRKETFPLVRFGSFSRSDALSQEAYDMNVALASRPLEAVLFSCLRMAQRSGEDQLFRAEFHQFRAANIARAAALEAGALRAELARVNSSHSMKVGLAATLVPRTLRSMAAKREARNMAEAPAPARTSAPVASVIVPVYNDEVHLQGCLDSILGQTFSDFEVILVDDGSTDETPAVCESYAAKDGRIRVIHQANGGLSSARNAGIDAAAGAWLAFVDSDDHLHPAFLSTLLGAAIGTGSEMAICGIQRFSHEVPAPPAPLHSEAIVRTGREVCEILDVYEGYYYPCAWGKVYARHLFDDLRYPVGRLYEDEFTTFKAIYPCASIVEVGQVLYGYRDNPEGIINSGFSLKRCDRVACMEERMDYFEKHGEAELAEHARAMRDEMLEWLVDTARANGVYDRLPARYRKLHEDNRARA